MDLAAEQIDALDLLPVLQKFRLAHYRKMAEPTDAISQNQPGDVLAGFRRHLKGRSSTHEKRITRVS